MSEFARAEATSRKKKSIFVDVFHFHHFLPKFIWLHSCRCVDPDVLVHVCCFPHSTSVTVCQCKSQPVEREGEKEIKRDSFIISRHLIFIMCVTCCSCWHGKTSHLFSLAWYVYLSYFAIHLVSRIISNDTSCSINIDSVYISCDTSEQEDQDKTTTKKVTAWQCLKLQQCEETMRHFN